MEIKHASLREYAKVKPLEKLNDEFSLCKVYVQGIGKNRNLSYMSKKNIQKALPSLSYAPVVGHLIPKHDEDGNLVGHYLGGHDMTITEDWQLKPLTVPFGVVMDDSFDFETVEEYGSEIEYVTALAILWTGRYPELEDAIYSEDVWFNQSMEINVDQYRILEEDSNYIELLEWSYSALCLLGLSDNPEEHTEPCFISSKVIPVEYSFEDNEFKQSMSEFKEKLKSYFAQSPEEGGSEMTEEILNGILSEFNVELAELDFNIEEGMTEEDFRAKITEFMENKSEDKSKESKGFSTYNQKREALENALDHAVVREGEKVVSETFYWVCDFDDEYVFVTRYFYSDEEYQSDHGRFKYTFDDETKVAEIAGEFEDMVLMWLTLEESEKLEKTRKDYEALIRYKQDCEEEEHKKAVIEILSAFEDIYETDEFIQFIDKVFEIKDLNEIETKCFAIRGKQVEINNEENTTKIPKVPVGKQASKSEPYGGLFSMYSEK